MFFLLAPWSWCNTRTNDIKKNANFLFFFKGVVDKDLRRNIRLQILFLVCLCDATLGCTPGESPLKLENRSDSFVKGCYCKKERLSLCFEIQRGFVQLTDTNNNVLVQFSKPNRQRTHVKVLGHDFLW